MDIHTNQLIILMKEYIIDMSNNLNNLHKLKIYEGLTNGYSIIFNELNIIIKNNIEIDEVSIDSINCDELDKELIDKEFIESLSLEYDSQISSVSSTENNWATSTKKFFFG